MFITVEFTIQVVSYQYFYMQFYTFDLDFFIT